jgi:hypothetical protein
VVGGALDATPRVSCLPSSFICIILALVRLALVIAIDTLLVTETKSSHYTVYGLQTRAFTYSLSPKRQIPVLFESRSHANA